MSDEVPTRDPRRRRVLRDIAGHRCRQRPAARGSDDPDRRALIRARRARDTELSSARPSSDRVAGDDASGGPRDPEPGSPSRSRRSRAPSARSSGSRSRRCSLSARAYRGLPRTADRDVPLTRADRRCRSQRSRVQFDRDHTTVLHAVRAVSSPLCGPTPRWLTPSTVHESSSVHTSRHHCRLLNVPPTVHPSRPPDETAAGEAMTVSSPQPSTTLNTSESDRKMQDVSMKLSTFTRKTPHRPPARRAGPFRRRSTLPSLGGIQLDAAGSSPRRCAPPTWSSG